MPQQDTSLHEFNTPEILRVVWEIFAELARSSDVRDKSKYFTLMGENNVYFKAFDVCQANSLIPPNTNKQKCPSFKHVVLKVYHSAINLGLILPHSPAETANLNYNQQYGVFHFTDEGVRYFSEGFISIEDLGYLGNALFELKERTGFIEEGQIELLLEAQRCVKSACYRAGMVVIGVASEDVCLGLLDSIPVNCQAPASGSELSSDWKNCCNPTLSFSARWKPGVRILNAIKGVLRIQGRGEPWWQWWEMIPGSLFTLGEAVRVARNSAAHDPDRQFTRAEVALLLSAMPTQFEMVMSIANFLRKTPSGLTPISFLE